MASPGDKAEHTFYNIKLRGRILADKAKLFLSDGFWKTRKAVSRGAEKVKEAAEKVEDRA